MLARLVSRLLNAKQPNPPQIRHQSSRSDNTGWWAPPPRPPGNGDGDGDYIYRVNLSPGGGGAYKYDVKVDGDQVVIRGTASDSSTFELHHRLPPGVDLGSVKTQLDSQGTVTITAKIKNF